MKADYICIFSKHIDKLYLYITSLLGKNYIFFQMNNKVGGETFSNIFRLCFFKKTLCSIQVVSMNEHSGMKEVWRIEFGFLEFSKSHFDAILQFQTTCMPIAHCAFIVNHIFSRVCCLPYPTQPTPLSFESS